MRASSTNSATPRPLPIRPAVAFDVGADGVEAEIECGAAQADVNLMKGTEAKHIEDKL